MTGLIEGYLQQGKENATTTEELLVLIGVNDRRKITEQIAKERECGCLILSNPQVKGYYLPDDGEKGEMEIQEYIRSMKNRANSLCRVISAAENIYQLNVNGW